MLTFLWSLLGFLLARLLYDYIRTMARKQGVTPLRWALEVAGSLIYLGAVATAFVIMIAWYLTRHP